MRGLTYEREIEERRKEQERIPRTLAIWNRLDTLLDVVKHHSDPRLPQLKRWEEVMGLAVAGAREISEREYASWDEALAIMERT